jgi:hypothetical protein
MTTRKAIAEDVRRTAGELLCLGKTSVGGKEI